MNAGPSGSNTTSASTSAPDLSTLIGAAKDSGNLSTAAVQALSINDLGAQIQAGFGISVDDVKSSDAIFLFIALDDSTSIRMVPGNTEAVRDGVNLILQSLAETKQISSIYVYCTQFNRGLLYPVTPLGIKDPSDPTGKKLILNTQLMLTAQNYNPSGGTPFYDTMLTVLGTAVAKVQEFADAGVPARAITVAITDGENYGGKKVHPESCTPVISDMLRSEAHIVAFMGISDGKTDFVDIATRMGIPRNWVRTPTDDPSSIRKEFAVVSQSAVRASQVGGGAAFSKVAAGGFGG